MNSITEPSNTPQWLHQQIKRGLQSLLCLSLDGQPSADVIAGTMLAWCRAITTNRWLTEEQDAPRFQAAFDALLARSHRWPAPADLLAALPPVAEATRRDKQPRLRVVSEEGRLRGLRAIEAIASELHVNIPRQRRDEK